MCGLTLSLRFVGDPDHTPPHSEIDSLITTNSRRGPDSSAIFRKVFTTCEGCHVELVLAASVLGLRGDGITSQPIISERGVLGWNGQVFDGLQVNPGENDTRKIFDKLEGGENPWDILDKIEGPYAFIYLNLETSTLYFAVDPLSRRSLLVHPSIENLIDPVRLLVLSSTRSSVDRFGRINDAIPDSNSTTPTIDDIHLFIQNLTESIRKRTENIPVQSPGVARIAVLFSGGVDCTLLCGLLHRVLPPDEPVELVNVAFDRPDLPPSLRKKDLVRQLEQRQKEKSEKWLVPDRLSGIEALQELGTVCPREWRFVEVNVTYDECQIHRQEVLDLMYPSKKEMDLSLAYPLFFASRGQGEISGHDGKEPYQVQAKVYFSGLGADEQLGGYSRHRRAYERSSWKGLIEEIQNDVWRLPSRNLARDDRLISSFARDARYPYLDLKFLSYLSSLPIWLKCQLSSDPAHVPGKGDKMLLRLAAAQIGLEKTSQRVKRAMQFGSRSSKMGSGIKGPKAGEYELDMG
ncbi:hypothetical protein TREMEDRAFT_72060 [Tremella mesenterica DSM 1558]|uniref:uncharacterized protein n=1 Tax=Tremella mesenterica (strain ATCC 24925 / CBS 8224 / DSM 1558 / NBRC 9311 / NRRL Y-6157 / RJB 2259-6 / UBC 559-6) TaxID=578456 RepID=UPI0003F4A40B|nr:uncharacterized protein TREMEDRAFT_72060 [Tremella mesenterica DSM 1558]EIW67931.1 hypothetical protein TREMEDRAFT_72060 [Tremella mesenterica DSM 1558]